jgi:hypothetical protein
MNQTYPNRTLQAIAASLGAGGIGAYIITALVAGSVTAQNLAVTNINATGTVAIAGDLSVSSTVLKVNASASKIGVNTSTNLGADLTVHDAFNVASSTIQIGAAADGTNHNAELCEWNGVNFSKLYFGGDTTAISVTTSTVCP